MSHIEIAKTSEEEAGPKITIEGWDIKDAELSKLLEETAKFLRNPKSVEAGDDTELTFRTVETGDLFIVSHRS